VNAFYLSVLFYRFSSLFLAVLTISLESAYFYLTHTKPMSILANKCKSDILYLQAKIRGENKSKCIIFPPLFYAALQYQNDCTRIYCIYRISLLQYIAVATYPHAGTETPSEKLYGWIHNKTDRKQLTMAIYLYVYFSRKSNEEGR